MPVYEADADYDKKKRLNNMLHEVDKSLDKLKAIKLTILEEKISLAPVGFKENYTYEDGDSESDSDDDEYEDNHLIVDESEGDDDLKACFPCPFCYLDIELHLICSHLQEEHFFDLKNAVCPLCAANLGKDAVEHFIVQHASSLKRRKKSLKSGFWNGGSAMLGKELSSFLGSSMTGKGNAQECIPDPLLPPFLYRAPIAETEGIQKDDCSNKVSVASDLKSVEPTSQDNSHEENIEEKRQRAAFAQQLIMSTIF